MDGAQTTSRSYIGDYPAVGTQAKVYDMGRIVYEVKKATAQAQSEKVALLAAFKRELDASSLAAHTKSGTAPSLATNKASQPNSLVDRINSFLDKTYPGWKFAKVLEDDMRDCFPDGNRPKNPSWAQGDFDGDGQVDYAYQISTPKGQRILYGFLATGRALVADRGNRDWVVPVGVARKGREVYDFSNDNSFTLVTDAITLSYCGKGEHTYVYKKDKFIDIHSGD